MTKNRLKLAVWAIATATALPASMSATTEMQVATDFIDGYQLAKRGYVTNMYRTPAGLVMTNTTGADITLVANDGTQRTLIDNPGAGYLINVSPDGRTIGFKSINKQSKQAPALLDIATGAVKLLEGYGQNCGQVSFAADGTIVYTVESTLVVRRPDGTRQELAMPFYTNIVNINPQGTVVAFSNIDGDFYTMGLADGVAHKHGQNVGAYNPVWSPDGSKIAVQTVFGKLFTVTAANLECRYDLGDASSLTWADNDVLMLTRDEFAGEMQISGGSVVKTRFDGSDMTPVINNDASLPAAVMADNDGNLAVAYATGADRGIWTIKAQPTKLGMGAKSLQRNILRIPADKVIGSATNIRDYFELTADTSAKPGMRKGNNIGVRDIPYINQVYDTPTSYDGNNKYGFVCCAPSSCCMNLGYYKLLNHDHPVTSRASGIGSVYYSWYVGRDYTSPKTGYTFNDRASGNGSTNVGGGYGYMWTGSYSPSSRMANFYKNNGCTSSFASSWDVFKTEANANRPYTICLKNGTGGHVVLGFLVNKKASGDGNTISAATGCFVCQDPYGDYNHGYYNWDGRWSSYDWVGYNTGQKNIGVFYWGCKATAPSTPTPVTPKITFTPSTIQFNCKVDEHPSVTVKVTGTGLSSVITVGSITPGRFTPSVSELPVAGGSFTVTFNISDKAGTYGPGGTGVDYDFFIRLKSGNDVNVTVPVRATVTEPEKPVDPDPVTPEPNPGEQVTYKDQIEGMDQGWIFSTNKGNLASGASWFTADASANMARSLAVIGENLYVANDKAWGSAPGIVIVDAKTGAKKGDLSVDGITGGTTKISSLKAMGTTLLASNFATATQPLKVYKWTNGAGAPTCILETTAHGIPAGEHMGVSGTMDNGRIAFSDGNKVVWFAVKNGAVDANPNVITLAESAGGNRSADQVTFNADGTFWLVNKDITPTLYTAAGAKKEAIPADAVGKVYGTSAAYFNYGTHKYVAAVTTLGGTTSAAWSNGAAALVDVTNGAAAGTRVGIYPSNGLGETAWGGTAGVTDICHRLSDTNNSQVDLYVLVPQQGIANYRFIGKSSAVTDIAVDTDTADAPAEFYTLQGVRVPADNLTPGLYIRRQANRATKVLIK